MDLLTYLCLPSIVFTTLSGSSLAFGLLVSTLICSLISLTNHKLRIYYNSTQIAFIFAAIASIFFIFFISNQFDLSKQLPTIALFILIFPLTNIFLHALLKNDSQLKNTITRSFYALSFFCILSYIYPLTPGQYSTLNKPIFPFGEPSHFALAFSPIAIAYSHLLKPVNRWVLFLFVAILATTLPSITLAGTALLLLSTSLVKRISVLLAALFSVALLLLFGSPEYFLNRIQITSDSENLSSLVYLQGILSAQYGIGTNYGLGIGFQLLGTEPDNAATEIIYMLSGNTFNRADGGFLAAKLTSELGFMGLMISTALALISLQSVLLLRKITLTSKYFQSENLLAPVLIHSIRISLILELIVRGYGYFSPNFLLFLATFNLQGNFLNSIHHRNKTKSSRITQLSKNIL